MTLSSLPKCLNVRLAASLAVISLVTCATPAFAQNRYKKSCAVDDPKSCIQPMVKGETAPFSGQLMNTRRAIVSVQKIGAYETTKDLDIERINKLHAIDMQGKDDKYSNDMSAAQEKIDLLDQRLKEAIGIPLWEEPIFVMVVSAVLATAATVAMYKLVQKTK